MTEAEWLNGADPTPLLEFLRGKVSDRKLRLFAVACCRRIWHLIPEEGHLAVEVVERFTEGLGTDEERSEARKTAQQVAQGRGVMRYPDAPKWQRRAASTVYYAAARDALEAAQNAPQLEIECLVWRAAAGHVPTTTSAI